jgi:hypothetical protein
MAIKRRGIVAVPGEYKYGTTTEKKTAEEMKADFEREGYMDLCESRAREAEQLLELIAAGRDSRHLYHVKGIGSQTPTPKP